MSGIVNWDEIDRLEHCSDVEDLWAQALDLLSGIGFDFVIYLTVDEAFGAPQLFTNAPAVHAGTPAANDPFLAHCCSSYAATFTGAEFADDYAYLGEQERAFIRAASEKTGFHAGIALPMRLQGSARFGGFNLGTGKTRAEFEAMVEGRIEELRFLCLVVHRKMEELTAGGAGEAAFRQRLLAPFPKARAALSPREQEVMYLFSQGLSTKQAAEACQISTHTVSDYAKSAYRKLGVRNRVAAVRQYEALLASAEAAE